MAVASALEKHPAQAVVGAFGHVIVPAHGLPIEPSGFDPLWPRSQHQGPARMHRAALALIQWLRLGQQPQRLKRAGRRGVARRP